MFRVSGAFEAAGDGGRGSVPLAFVPGPEFGRHRPAGELPRADAETEQAAGAAPVQRDRPAAAFKVLEHDPFQLKRPHMPCSAGLGPHSSPRPPSPTGFTHLISTCLRCACRPCCTGLCPLPSPPRRRGPISDSRCRRSRRRTGSTADAAARTEAGPRLGGRGDGSRLYDPKPPKTDVCMR